MNFCSTALLALITLTGSALASLKVLDLRVDSQAKPTGISTTPQFSWRLASDERAKRQQGYEILAATEIEKLDPEKADLWTAKEERSDLKRFISWQGKPLKKGQKVFWKVRVTDESKELSDWSDPASFTVGEPLTLPKPARVSHFESNLPAVNKFYSETVDVLEKRLEKFAEGDQEALGLGLDLQRAAREYLYHFDSSLHLKEWIKLADKNRLEETYFPLHPASKKFGSVHSDAGITVHYPLWWMDGDHSYATERWPIMESYMQGREKADSLLKGSAWGESYRSDQVPVPYSDLCHLAFTNRLVLEFARPAQQILNSVRYQDYGARMRLQFKAQYLDDKGAMKEKSQTAAVLALRSAVLTAEQRTQVLQDLLADLKKNGAKVDKLGAYFLPQVLMLTGHTDVLISLLENLTEDQQKIFRASGATEWFMSHLAGINALDPGFAQIHIAPKIPSSKMLTSVKSHYHSPAGKIAIHWKKEEKGALKIELVIPAGSIAKIDFPVGPDQKITETGKPLSETKGVKLISQTDGLAEVYSQSGTYSFTIK